VALCARGHLIAKIPRLLDLLQYRRQVNRKPVEVTAIVVMRSSSTLTPPTKGPRMIHAFREPKSSDKATEPSPGPVAGLWDGDYADAASRGACVRPAYSINWRGAIPMGSVLDRGQQVMFAVSTDGGGPDERRNRCGARRSRGGAYITAIREAAAKKVSQRWIFPKTTSTAIP
jgi:hypothetical protein